MTMRLLGLFLAAALLPRPTYAQTIAAPVQAGACAVFVRLAPPGGAGTEIELEVNKKKLPRTAADGKAEIRIALTGPLGEGDELRARRLDPSNAAGTLGPAVSVVKGGGPAECSAPSDDDVVSDEREPFEASGYVGGAIDNFAPASVGGYQNSEAGGRQNRVVGGFDFEFRITGSPESRRQVWIFGETLHGVRGADINCAPDNTDKPAVCDKLSVTNARAQLQYVLEHATSMEAFGGVRAEFLTLQGDTDTPAKLYATVRFGVMMLNGQVMTTDPLTSQERQIKANHAYRADHVGGGLLMPKGNFTGSYLEIGWGRTDLFDNEDIKNHWRRLKIDGALSIKLKGPMYGFVQLFADFDPSGKSADSVQTFFGMSFEIPEFFK